MVWLSGDYLHGKFEHKYKRKLNNLEKAQVRMRLFHFQRSLQTDGLRWSFVRVPLYKCFPQLSEVPLDIRKYWYVVLAVHFFPGTMCNSADTAVTCMAKLTVEL